jgi:excisionase family DNA binding protein
MHTYFSIAQVSTKRQRARSTLRKLVADGQRRASRISRRTIRISDADLQAYLDGRANASAPVSYVKVNGAAQ